MASRYPNNGVQKRGVRNSRATREWPATNGSSAYSRLDFSKMKVSDTSLFELPALCNALAAAGSCCKLLQEGAWRV